MGKFTDFLKSDSSSTHSSSNNLGATSGSDPVSADRAQKHHGRSGSIGDRDTHSSGTHRDNTDSVASSRGGSVGNDGGVANTAADGLGVGGHHSGGTGTGRSGQHESGRERLEDAEAVATGEPGRHHRDHTDRDGDGLDDRSTGNQERVISANGDFSQKHSLGHPQSRGNVDLSNAEHSHHHLAPVMHEKVKHHETEEILREREKHEHINHIKHAVVPIHDREVREEVHHDHTHAPTRIEERHVNSAEDNDTFAAIGARHKDTTHHHDKTKEIVDLGERTRVVEHHHVDNVIQPVIEKETHDRHRVHTTIPIHHTTHHAPIIHDSVHHSPISMDEFTKRGGKLDSTTTHSALGSNVLAATECERKVDGPAEGLMEKLHLK